MRKSPLTKLRKRHDEADDWAISFADMMTLLLCFFILMVSISAVDIERYDDVAESLTSAMDPKKKVEKKLPEPEPLRQKLRQQVEQPAAVPHPVTSPTIHGDKPLDDVMDALTDKLRSAGAAVHVERRKNSLAVRLRGPVFFELGSANLTAESGEYLRTIAEELLPTQYRITIEGHTDDLPISTRLFPSNWELSSARASAVARFFIKSRIAADRVEVRGFAHTNPLVPNRDNLGKPIPENQVLNRRVVVVVSPAGTPPASE